MSRAAELITIIGDDDDDSCCALMEAHAAAADGKALVCLRLEVSERVSNWRQPLLCFAGRAAAGGLAR